MKLKGLSILILFISSSVFGQIESGMYSLSYVPQTVYFNPAFRPKTPFNIGFSVPIGISSPFSYNDIVSVNNNDATVIDASRFYNNLKPNSYLSTDLSPDLTIGFRINKRWYANLSMREIGQGGFRLPREFLDLAINGNAKDSNLPPISVGNLNIVANHYREYGANVSFIYNCKWQFGARLKYLIGYQNVHTTTSDIYLKTDPSNYQLSLQGQFVMKTSGTDDNSLNKFGSNPFRMSGNWGLGLDLGAVYKHSDKWSFSGSLTDLGFITWKEHNNIIQNNPNASFVFSGLNLDAYANSDNYFRTILDSIEKQFNLSNNVLTESYTTSLITKLFLNAEYHLNKYFDFGGTANLSIRYKAFFPILSVYAKLNLANWIQMQANYNITPNSFTNIGLGTVFNLGPIQLFMASDNILGIAFYPKSSKDVSIRAGLNIVWPFSKKKDYCDIEDDLDTDSEENVEKETISQDTTQSNIEDTIKPVLIVNPPAESVIDSVRDTFTNFNIDTIIPQKDVDKDGIPDSVDLCPVDKGSLKYLGCPNKKMMDKARGKEGSGYYPGPSIPIPNIKVPDVIDTVLDILNTIEPSGIKIPSSGGGQNRTPTPTPPSPSGGAGK